jgi:hypothetical protein
MGADSTGGGVALGVNAYHFSEKCQRPADISVVRGCSLVDEQIRPAFGEQE